MSISLNFTYRGKSKNKFKDFSARLKADRVNGKFNVNSCSKTIGDLKEFIIENSKLNKLKNFSKGQIQLYDNNKPVTAKDGKKS